MIVKCDYFELHTHEYPDDWFFGGPRNADPRADPRWLPTTYRYVDDRLDTIYDTQTPKCDEQAIDEFTKVASFGPDFNPVWLMVKRPWSDKFETLTLMYNKATDEVSDL